MFRTKWCCSMPKNVQSGSGILKITVKHSGRVFGPPSTSNKISWNCNIQGHLHHIAPKHTHVTLTLSDVTSNYHLHCASYTSTSSVEHSSYASWLTSKKVIIGMYAPTASTALPSCQSSQSSVVLKDTPVSQHNHRQSCVWHIRRSARPSMRLKRALLADWRCYILPCKVLVNCCFFTVL